MHLSHRKSLKTIIYIYLYGACLSIYLSNKNT
eukprot:UN01176